MLKRILIAIAIWTVSCSSAATAQKAGHSGEILFICSYNADTYYSNEFTNDFVNEYSSLGGKNDLAVEAMNCSTLDTHSRWMNSMYEILERHSDPDLIILYGPEAWACYLSLTEPKWKTIPICLISAQRYGARMEFDDVPAVHRNAANRNQTVDFIQLAQDFNIKMCYYYEYGAKEDVQILKTLCPDITTVAVVGDNSYGGYSMLKYVTDVMTKNFPNINVVEVDGSREDTESAKQTLGHLPTNSGVIFCVWRYDKKGVISLMKEKELVSELSNTPIMTLTGRGFGEWALGGSNPQYSWHDGRILPSMLAYQLIDQNIDIEPYYYRCPNQYQFDMSIMEQLNLDTTLLPDDVHIINSDMTISELYKVYPIRFTLIIGVMLVLLLAFIITLVYSWRINGMKNKLLESERQLRLDNEALEKSEVALRAEKEKVEASNKMKTHFIHNISHEIRTPLNAIQGFSQIILDPSMSLDTKTRESLNDRIGHNVQLVTDIVDDILIYSDLESSEYAMRMSDINCLNFCRSVIEKAASYNHQNVSFSHSFNVPESLTFHSDEQLMQQALLQILKNAWKFTENGSIFFLASLDNDNKKIVFSVEDTGPGIPHDKAEYVFEMFKKLNDFTQGTGLGLSTCRLIAKKLGADVFLDTTYSKGSRFVFTLPL